MAAKELTEALNSEQENKGKNFIIIIFNFYYYWRGKETMPPVKILFIVSSNLIGHC